jgi:hypothetical protein
MAAGERIRVVSDVVVEEVGHRTIAEVKPGDWIARMLRHPGDAVRYREVVSSRPTEWPNYLVSFAGLGDAGSAEYRPPYERVRVFRRVD